MPFKYNPPTRTHCIICEQLKNDESHAIIDSHSGKSSSANNFPFHNWYHFVLGYAPEFPEFMIKKEGINPSHSVLDPFMGSGTTLVTCKQHGIKSYGVDANDFMVGAAAIKLNWSHDVEKLSSESLELLDRLYSKISEYKWLDSGTVQLELFENNIGKDYNTLVGKNRPDMLKTKYISDKPLAKAEIISQLINKQFGNSPFIELYTLALSSIIVPISNVRYSPAFGIAKPKDDADVYGLFSKKLMRMVSDLRTLTPNASKTLSKVFLSDTRQLGKCIPENMADFIITSPPYAGDHEYTKHTRLELIFQGYARTIQEFRVIKKRMITASTTNVYKDDNDKQSIVDLQSIIDITSLIEARLKVDGATSGFERMYTKTVWEYFGGMYKSLEQCFKVLKPNGKIALLVSDSHAFKMVHIETSKILLEIGLILGYVNPEILLWQLKKSTSHKYSLREEILILQKPFSEDESKGYKS